MLPFPPNTFYPIPNLFYYMYETHRKHQHNQFNLKEYFVYVILFLKVNRNVALAYVVKSIMPSYLRLNLPYRINLTWGQGIILMALSKVVSI